MTGRLDRRIRCSSPPASTMNPTACSAQLRRPMDWTATKNNLDQELPGGSRIFALCKDAGFPQEYGTSLFATEDSLCQASIPGGQRQIHQEETHDPVFV